MKPYSAELRQRVLADCDDGVPNAEVAAEYRVSSSWVRRLLQRRRETGSIEPIPQRHGPLPKWEPHAAAIAEAVRREPDATLEEHRAALGVDLSISALWRAIDATGLTVKKKRRGPPSRTAPTWPRPGVAGGPRCRGWTPRAWSSSTRPGPAPP
jgi:transposase